MAQVIRWLCALVTGSVVSGFAFLLLTGKYYKEGPVVLTLTADHGLHRGDLYVLGGWLVAVLALVWLAASPRSRRAGRSPSLPGVRDTAG